MAEAAAFYNAEDDDAEDNDAETDYDYASDSDSDSKEEDTCGCCGQTRLVAMWNAGCQPNGQPWAPNTLFCRVCIDESPYSHTSSDGSDADGASAPGVSECPRDKI